MFNPLSAKSQFLSNDTWLKEHADLINSEAFSRGVTHALAEYASMQPSSEQLAGANRFLEIFTALASKPAPVSNSLTAPRLRPPEQLPSQLQPKKK